MKPPSESARRVLQRYKEANALGSEQRARLGEVVRERVLRGDVPRFDVVLGVQAAAAHSSWAHKLWTSTLGKWAVGGMAIGAVGVGGYTLLRQAAPPSLREVPSAIVTPPSSQPALPVPPPAALSADAALPTPADDPTPPRASRSRADKASSGAPSPSGEPTVDEEVKLVSAAQSALRAGDAKQALELLAQHAARFPNGKLATLRQVTHMMALCQSGRAAQARQEAADFVAARPGSPFVERVKNICARSN